MEKQEEKNNIYDLLKLYNAQKPDTYYHLYRNGPLLRRYDTDLNNFLSDYPENEWFTLAYIHNLTIGNYIYYKHTTCRILANRVVKRKKPYKITIQLDVQVILTGANLKFNGEPLQVVIIPKLKQQVLFTSRHIIILDIVSIFINNFSPLHNFRILFE